MKNKPHSDAKNSLGLLLGGSAMAVMVLIVCLCLPFGSSKKAAVLNQALRGSAIDSTANSAPTVSPAGTNSSFARSDGAQKAAKYLEVGFDTLAAFDAIVEYEMVNANTNASYYAPKLTTPVPENIKALDRKEVAVQGFMLPLKGDEGRIQEFILLKNQMMCCFGKPPNVNEWVHVRMTGKGIKPLMDQVITIYGTLHVGSYNENRQMLGLYQLDGDGVGLATQL